MRRYIFSWRSFSLYITLLCVLLLAPLSGWGLRNPIKGGELGDYVMHVLVYLPWMFGGWIIFHERLRQWLWFALGTVVVIALEVLQILLPYRGFNIFDIVAGEFGLLLSWVILALRNATIKHYYK